MEIKLFDKRNIEELAWESFSNGQEAKAYLLPLIQEGTQAFIDNLIAEVSVLAAGKTLLPIVKPQRKTKIPNSYIASNITQYFHYSQEEILNNAKYSPFLKRLSKLAFPPVISLAKAMGFEDVVFINNWLLSSNLAPQLDLQLLPDIKACLTKHFPNSALVFKGVTEATDQQLKVSLESIGFASVVSRQVYVMKPETKKYKKKRPWVTDKKLWEKAKEEGMEWSQIQLLCNGDAALTNQYYTELYLEKYSYFNPQYTTGYIELAQKAGILTFHQLKEKGKILAVQAFSEVNGVLTTPFIGYKQDEPLEKGLYRIMNMRLMDEAIQKGLVLNMSSGASKFKKARAGEASFEYNMTYSCHLPFYTRFIWQIMLFFSEKYIKPSMIKYEV
ncbi:hypothetical protein R9C00_24450 [Flammeovirgaceae bacterium SG7u.111]|nr:hypothetical protein [Flammeovirgaceae bacterium SG7u.132]WPO34854.1 hypothetical protein R9C00_24450 [Flammeovirgaceae bacterium SG7u.111]